MERKIVKFEVKSVDQETGIIEGYGATFASKPDFYGDIIDPGAFSKTLKENADSIVSLFNHNVMEPIGVPELKQDSNGLFARICLVMELQKARDTLALARAGVIKRLSIGYDTIKSDFIDGVRHLKEVRLYDVSPVVFAANPAARIVAVKAATTFDDLPLADRDREWDATASERRVRAWAGGEDSMNWDKYRRAFFWYDSDNSELFGSYKLGFADIITGKLTAIPRGIFAVAGVLMGARGGVNIPAADKAKVKAHAERYYEKMRKQFDDESIVAPWAKSEDMVEMELKPYPNEHACRLRDPDDFQEDSFRRVSRASDGKKYSVIMGRLKGEDTLTEQAYRYNKDIWDANDAKSHCKDHDGKFEPATEKQEKSGRVLSAASMSKVRAALEALQALLEAAEGEEESGKSTPYPDGGSYEAAELDAVIAGLKASNEGFDTKEAEARIDKLLIKLKGE